MSEEMSIEQYRRLHASGNKKVKNATKVKPGEVIDYNSEVLMNRTDITFPSKIECYMYHLLMNANVDFEFQHKITLQAKDKDKSVPSVAMYIDFVVHSNNPPLYIDTKGHQTAV